MQTKRLPAFDADIDRASPEFKRLVGYVDGTNRANSIEPYAVYETADPRLALSHQLARHEVGLAPGDVTIVQARQTGKVRRDPSYVGHWLNHERLTEAQAEALA